MHNGKLIGPTHCDATSDDTTGTGMPVRLTEMEFDNIPLLAYYSL